MYTNHYAFSLLCVYYYLLCVTYSVQFIVCSVALFAIPPNIYFRRMGTCLLVLGPCAGKGWSVQWGTHARRSLLSKLKIRCGRLVPLPCEFEARKLWLFADQLATVSPKRGVQLALSARFSTITLHSRTKVISSLAECSKVISW